MSTNVAALELNRNSLWKMKKNITNSFKFTKLVYSFTNLKKLDKKETSLFLLGEVIGFAIFWYIQVCCIYIMWLKQFKLLKIPIAVVSIVVVGALTCYALLHLVGVLKTTQLIMKCCPIWKLMEIYQAFCLDVAQGHMKGAPNETQTHSCRFASRAC